MKKLIKIMLILCVLCLVILMTTGCKKKDKQNKVDNVAKHFTRGEWKEEFDQEKSKVVTKYSNEFAKINFNLPEGWKQSTDAEIADIMKINVNDLNGNRESLIEFSKNSVIYAMMAKNEKTGSDITILFENVTDNVTAESFLKELKQEFEAVEDVNYKIGEQYNTTISNQTYKSLDVTVEYENGYSIKQHYYARKQDNYIVNIILISLIPNQTQTILECFE